MESLINL